MKGKPVYTIGHSRHQLDAFVALLARHGVTALADVRSSPYSRFNPQFNRPELAAAAGEAGIRYVYLGVELGGRSDDPGCYEDGHIRYDRVAETESFQLGIARLDRGAREYTVALMCAEKEPLDCHRTLLVAPVLAARGLEVVHIHADGATETHEEAMSRLLEVVGLDPSGGLALRSRKELVAEAVALQGRRVGWREPSTAGEGAP